MRQAISAATAPTTGDTSADTPNIAVADKSAFDATTCRSLR